MGKSRAGKKVVVSIAALCAAYGAHAGRPLVIDDADPAERGWVEFEAGVAYVGDTGSEHWDFPFGLTYGLVRNLEVGLSFGGYIAEAAHHESGIGDLVVGAKWRFLESSPMGARHALAPSVKLPTADEKDGLGSGETDYDLAWLVSWALGDKAGIHYNLGYTFVGGADNVIHYGLAFDYQLVEPIQWVAELFAANEVTEVWDPAVACNSGFRWFATDDLTLDVAVGTKIRGDAPDFTATAGLTWAFGTDR